MVAATTRWGVPRVIFYTFTSFTLTWGWWWIPLRPYWVPGTKVND
jgi:hypothetical protein